MGEAYRATDASLGCEGPGPDELSRPTAGLRRPGHVFLDVLAELPVNTAAPGRIATRPGMQTNRSGWLRWVPGLFTLRQYEPSWLRHDIVAGLVMTTMLVPVGIAYAEASGLPGINGLYATIVPLLAYALFGPSRILVLGPDSALAAVILSVVLPLSSGDPQRARRAGRNDGDRVRRRVRGCRSRASRLHHRAAVETDPLRLHERHRADRDPEPDPEAPRLFRQGGRTAAPDAGNRREGVGGKHQRHGPRDRRQLARADSRAEAVAAPPRHADRRRRRDHRGRGVRSRIARRRLGARSVAAGAAGAASSAGAPRQPGARSSRVASRSRSYPSPTRACSPEPMRRVCEHRSTRTRRWWALASPTSRPASFRASRSAAVLRAHRSRKRLARRPS